MADTYDVASILNLNTSFSNNQAIIELATLDANREVRLFAPDAAIIDKAEITHELDKAASVELYITAKQQRYYDQLLTTLMMSGTPTLMLRVGLASGPSSNMLPWQEHLVVSHSASPHLDGHRIWIKTGDAIFNIDRADNKSRIRSGKISDIVKQIAAEADLEAVVEPTADSQQIFIQSNESDADFIVDRLIPRSLNEKGRGGYHLFIKDNVMHFHSADYQADVRSLDYFAPSSATQLKMIDESQKGLFEGAAGVVGLVHDPYTGVSQAIVSDPSKILNFSKTTPRLSSVPNAYQLMPYHLGTNRLDDAVALVQNKFDTAYNRMFKLELTMQQMPFVHVNDIINVNIRPSETTTSAWSGAYVVEGLKHVLDQGSLTSRFTLRRGELGALGRSFRGMGLDDVATRPNFAQGQALNIAEVRSSRVTRPGGTERLATGEIVKEISLV